MKKFSKIAYDFLTDLKNLFKIFLKYFRIIPVLILQK